MRQKLIGIGATVGVVMLAAGFVAAQSATDGQRAGAGAAVQAQQPPAPQGQVRPGRGPGQGRGRGQGPGGGQQAGPNRGPGRGMMGRGGGNGPQGLGPGRGAGGRFAGLALTEEQRVKVDDLQRSSRDQAAPIEDELQFAQKSLNRELFADKRDSAKIAGLTAKIATLQKQLADLHVKTATSVSDVLTAEQRETMRLHEGRGGGMRGGRGGFGRGQR